MNVLIAEDDPVSAMVLDALLRRHGHEVKVTSDGREAWNAFQQGSYPLAIIDWMMPEMDGLELCRHIRECKSAAYTCIIMLTAKQDRSDRLQALNAGVDVFMTKPLDCEEMEARLRVARRIIEMER